MIYGGKINKFLLMLFYQNSKWILVLFICFPYHSKWLIKNWGVLQGEFFRPPKKGKERTRKSLRNIFPKKIMAFLKTLWWEKLCFLLHCIIFFSQAVVVSFPLFTALYSVKLAQGLAFSFTMKVLARIKVLWDSISCLILYGQYARRTQTQSVHR